MLRECHQIMCGPNCVYLVSCDSNLIMSFGLLQKYQDDLADLPSVSGLQSTLYTGLTVALVATGASYLLQPQVCTSMLFLLLHACNKQSICQVSARIACLCCCNSLLIVCSQHWRHSSITPRAMSVSSSGGLWVQAWSPCCLL